MTPALSILDLAPVGARTGGAVAVRNTVALARRAEALGYVRYWVAEHHNIQGIASAATEVLIAAIASATSRLRVGAGGVMIPNHAPLHVVERFRTLEALFPGRIDLGIGRAPGTDPLTSSALHRRLSSPEDVNAQIAELLAFENGTFPEDHPYRAITPIPSDVRLPPLWMLGSTDAGARIAAALGIRYAFAGHFNLGHAIPAIRLYLSRFEPSDDLAAPEALLAVSGICGETDEHARELAAVSGLAHLRITQGVSLPLPSVEEAHAYPYTAAERAQVEQFLAGQVFGSPERVRDRLEELSARTGATELMMTTMLPDYEERLRSYERLAAVAGLRQGAASTTSDGLPL